MLVLRPAAPAAAGSRTRDARGMPGSSDRRRAVPRAAADRAPRSRARSRRSRSSSSGCDAKNAAMRSGAVRRSSISRRNRAGMPLRIEPRGDHVQHRLRVRLRFVRPAVAREQRRTAHLDRRARDVAVAQPRERAPQPDRDVRARPLLHLLHRVPAHDVPDLVPERARQLVELAARARSARGSRR